MNNDDRKRMGACKKTGCMACRKEGYWACALPIEYHHLLVGGLRVGHRYAVALCPWHHQGHPLRFKTIEQMREDYGPNLHDESRAFHERFGTDQELLDRQDDAIGVARTVIPGRPEGKKSRCTRPTKRVERPDGWRA